HVALLEIAEREGGGIRLAVAAHIEGEHSKPMMDQGGGQIEESGAQLIRSIGVRAMHHDKGALDRWLAIGQPAGNEPALQREVIVAAGKSDVAIVQVEVSGLGVEGLRMLVDELCGDKD